MLVVYYGFGSGLASGADYDYCYQLSQEQYGHEEQETSQSIAYHINKYFPTDFFAVNTRTTNKISTNPSSINTISTIEKVPNYFHNHPESAIKQTAVTPNIALRTLITKNSVGLPGFIFYLIGICYFEELDSVPNLLLFSLPYYHFQGFYL